MIDTTRLPVRPQNSDELKSLIGQEIGPTDWHEVTQERINAFADVTGDNQWIYVDPARAEARDLEPKTAHGLYSLPLGPAFSQTLLSFEAFAHSSLYGYDTVLIRTSLAVVTRVRSTTSCTSVCSVGIGIQIFSLLAKEIEGTENRIAT